MSSSYIPVLREGAIEQLISYKDALETTSETFSRLHQFIVLTEPPAKVVKLYKMWHPQLANICSTYVPIHASIALLRCVASHLHDRPLNVFLCRGLKVWTIDAFTEMKDHICRALYYECGTYDMISSCCGNQSDTVFFTFFHEMFVQLCDDDVLGKLYVLHALDILCTSGPLCRVTKLIRLYNPTPNEVLKRVCQGSTAILKSVMCDLSRYPLDMRTDAMKEQLMVALIHGPRFPETPLSPSESEGNIQWAREERWALGSQCNHSEITYAFHNVALAYHCVKGEPDGVQEMLISINPTPNQLMKLFALAVNHNNMACASLCAKKLEFHVIPLGDFICHPGNQEYLRASLHKAPLHSDLEEAVSSALHAIPILETHFHMLHEWAACDSTTYTSLKYTVERALHRGGEKCLVWIDDNYPDMINLLDPLLSGAVYNPDLAAAMLRVRSVPMDLRMGRGSPVKWKSDPLVHRWGPHRLWGLPILVAGCPSKRVKLDLMHVCLRHATESLVGRSVWCTVVNIQILNKCIQSVWQPADGLEYSLLQDFVSAMR